MNKMSKIFLLGFFIITSINPLHKINVISAPELFGIGTLSGYTISNSWVTFQMIDVSVKGNKISGNLVQTGGPTIYDRPTPNGKERPAGKIPFMMSIHNNQFQGWIMFRGHHRKFCGGQNAIPKKCLLQ